MGYRHMRRARCGGEGANAQSPRPSRRNIVCLILYMSLVVVNID